MQSEGAVRSEPGTAFPSRAPLVVASLWLLMALSSIVNIEPAPFDVVALGMCFLFVFLGLKVPSDLHLAVLLMAVFLLANAVSMVFASPNSAQPLPDMLVYAGLTAYLVVIWLILTSVIAADPARLVPVLWNGWLIATLLAVTLGMVGYFRLVPGHDALLMSGRAKGAFKDANVYGPYLIPIALYLLAQMRGRRLASNVVRLALFLYVMVGILIGFSRGAWGNFFVSFAVFALIEFLNARTVKDYMRLFSAGSAVIALTIALVVAAISTPQVGEMFRVRASLLQSYDVEVGGRFSTQKAALEEIGRNPIGLGPDRTQTDLGRTPHNVYLKIAAENGWIGAIAFMTFLAVTLWRGFWFALQPGLLQREFTVAYAATVGIVAESVIIDTVHWRHFFVLLALVWGPMVAARHYAVPAQDPCQRFGREPLKRSIVTPRPAGGSGF